MRGISLEWRTELTRTVPGGPQQTLDDAPAFLSEAEAILDWSFDHDRISQLTQPVLYMLAERELPLAASVAHRFAEVVPQTEIVEIADAGHMLTPTSRTRSRLR